MLEYTGYKGSTLKLGESLLKEVWNKQYVGLLLVSGEQLFYVLIVFPEWLHSVCDIWEGENRNEMKFSWTLAMHHIRSIFGQLGQCLNLFSVGQRLF